MSKSYRDGDRVPAEPGLHYCYLLHSIGWLNQGMIQDNSRQWWAEYYRNNPDRQHGPSSKVAFVPFCIAGSNFLSQADIDANAVEIL